MCLEGVALFGADDGLLSVLTVNKNNALSPAVVAKCNRIFASLAAADGQLYDAAGAKRAASRLTS